jgi:hypothetical protein
MNFDYSAHNCWAQSSVATLREVVAQAISVRVAEYNREPILEGGGQPSMYCCQRTQTSGLREYTEGCILDGQFCRV